MPSNILKCRIALVLLVGLLILSQSQCLAQQAPFDFGGHRVDFSVEGRSGFVVMPSHSALGGVKPWLWYAPTLLNVPSPRPDNPNAAEAWLFSRLLDQGVWIAGVDIGESYGNVPGRKEYSAFYQYVRKHYGLSTRPCLLAQSRGGLMLYNWAAENAHKVGCIAGIYTAANLESWPGLADARLQKAYGMNEAQLRKHLKENNPIDRLAPLARAKVPVFLLHGDSDKVVSLQQNTLEFEQRYKALGGNVQVEIIPGHGHEVVPQYFQSNSLLDFLTKHLVGGQF